MLRKKLPLMITAFIIMLIGLLLYCFYPRNKNDDNKTALASTTNNANNKDKNNTYIPPSDEYDDNNGNEDGTNMPIDYDNPDYDDITNEDSEVWAPATEIDLDPTSITVYVNKEYCLPQDYVPKGMVEPNIIFDIEGNDERKLLRPEAAKAIELLFEAANREGIVLYGISGYRSYDRQKDIFLSNIVKKGKQHTILYSAVPGTSEHQTGLAMDVSAKSINFKLISSFANSIEGRWLANNAHHYGFIVRYAKDKVDITGYAYEPWHIRYVGRNLANYLYDNELTLDEYYNYTPSEGFNFEELYAELINYIPPTPTPTPIPTPIPVDGKGRPILIDENGQPVLDVNGNPILIDEQGNPIPTDANGNPILLDENGNPIPTDANGNPIPEDENNDPVPNDENDDLNPIDENDNPVPNDGYTHNFPLEEYGLEILFDEAGFPMLNDNGFPIIVNNLGQLVLIDEDGYPVLDGDEQPILMDQNGQPIYTD